MRMINLQLPIAPTPITVYQYLAYPLAALLNYRECLPWFYSNYIQLEFFKEEKGVTLDFIGGWVTDIPWISYQYLEKENFVNHNPGIHASIKNYLKNGWYFYSIFDEFYVPSRKMYQKMHSSYDFLLTGYNDQKQEYSILGYGQRWVFETTQVSYTDFQKAFESMLGGQFVILFRKREDFVCEFDLKFVHHMLADYFESKDTPARLRLSQRSALPNKTFGLNTYHSLIEYFRSLLDKSPPKDIRSSHRLLHALWEHKKCMLLRWEYWNQHEPGKGLNSFSGLYKKLEHDALALRNILLKYSLQEEPELVEKIINSLHELMRLESYVLEGLLELTCP